MKCFKPIVASFGIASSIFVSNEIQAEVIELTWNGGSQKAVNPFSNSFSAAPVTQDIDQLDEGQLDFAQWNDLFGGTGRTFALFTTMAPPGLISIREAFFGETLLPSTFDGNGAGTGTQFDGSGSAYLGFRTSVGDVGWFKIEFKALGAITYSVGQIGLNGDPVIVGGDQVIRGDVNCDGVVNLLDVQPFVDILIAGEFSGKADVNQDGNVDRLDIQPLIALIANLD